MDVRTLINPTAEIHQVTTLKAGDVYKRLETSTYSEDKMLFGIVVECLNNGDTAVVTSLEFYPPVYAGAVETKVRTFSGEAQMALFPCHIEEFRTNLSAAIDRQAAYLDGIRRQFESASETLSRMEHVKETGAITAAATVQILSA